MAEQRLSAWGWFVRAFAGGFGAMIGVMTALTFILVFGYVLVAVGVMASSFGAVRIGPVTDTIPATSWGTEGHAYFTPPQVEAFSEPLAAYTAETPTDSAAADVAVAPYNTPATFDHDSTSGETSAQ